MMTAAMVGYTLGYVLAAATRTHDGPALYVPLPAVLRRFVRR
jgi:hypothetical protein